MVTGDRKKRYSHDILETWSSELEEKQLVSQEKDGCGSAQHSPSIQSRKVSTRSSEVLEGGTRVEHSLPSGSDRSDPSNPHRKLSHPLASPDSTPKRITGSTPPPNSIPSTSTDPTPHPLTSGDSTPSSSPSIRNKAANKEDQTVPQLDLMSLAPEQKQVVSGVERGWPEGGRLAAAKPAEMAPTVKDIARKMHG